MPALAEDTGAFQSRGAAARDHDAPGAVTAADDDLWPVVFPGGGGIVDTGGPVLTHAVHHAHTRTDAFLLAGPDLVDDMGVGDMGPGHGDHVQQAVADGMAGGGEIDDARGVEHRQAHGPAEGAGGLEPRRDG